MGWLMFEIINQGTMLYLAYEIKFLSKSCYYLWQNILFMGIINSLTLLVLLFSAKIYRYTYIFYTIQVLVRMISRIICIMFIFPETNFQMRGAEQNVIKIIRSLLRIRPFLCFRKVVDVDNSHFEALNNIKPEVKGRHFFPPTGAK